MVEQRIVLKVIHFTVFDRESQCWISFWLITFPFLYLSVALFDVPLQKETFDTIKTDAIVSLKYNSSRINVNTFVLEQIVGKFKDIFLMAMKGVFGKHSVHDARLDKSSTNIYLRIWQREEMEKLLQKVEDQSLCKQIFLAVAEADFDGSKYSLNPDIFSLSLCCQSCFDFDQQVIMEVGYFSFILQLVVILGKSQE